MIGAIHFEIGALFEELNMNTNWMSWAAATALSVAGLVAQMPVNDIVQVTFPSPVHVGSKLLDAGEYKIRQIPSNSQPRLLEFTTEKGTKIQTSITTIASIDNNETKDTSVVLKQIGGESYLHKIWIQGKTYGYEIPVDANVSTTAMSGAREMKMMATFTPAPTTQVEVARNEPAPLPLAAPVVVPEPAAAPTPAPAPTQSAALTPEPAVSAVDAEQTRPRTQTPAMPHTSLDWASYLAVGIAFMVAGLTIRPVRQQ